jgi:hypothetical protein
LQLKDIHFRLILEAQDYRLLIVGEDPERRRKSDIQDIVEIVRATAMTEDIETIVVQGTETIRRTGHNIRLIETFLEKEQSQSAIITIMEIIIAHAETIHHVITMGEASRHIKREILDISKDLIVGMEDILRTDKDR